MGRKSLLLPILRLSVPLVRQNYPMIYGGPRKWQGGSKIHQNADLTRFAISALKANELEGFKFKNFNCP